MDLVTLDEDYQQETFIQSYDSLIWTERFGYLTIPTMALSAFALVATLALLGRARTRSWAAERP